MKPELIVLGTSLGGLRALQALLADLPEVFPLPIAVVQHRGTTEGTMLRLAVQRSCPIPVREPHDKEEILPGRVYLAPADYHLLIEQGSFALSTDRPVNFARPSIDVLFQSAADAYGKGVVAVILTGAGRDGAEGTSTIKENGGFIIVQDPESAECPILPKAVLKAAEVDFVLPLQEIAFLLKKLGSSTNG